MKTIDPPKTVPASPLDLKAVVADLLDVRTDDDAFAAKIELVKERVRQGRTSEEP